MMVALAVGSSDSWVPWVQLFSGGLAGAILTVSAQKLIQLWESPSLIAEFGRNIEGTATKFRTETGTRQWIRVRVTNKGRSIARNVRVLVVSVKKISLHTLVAIVGNSRERS